MKSAICSNVTELVYHFHNSILSWFGKFGFIESEVTVIELSEVIKQFD